MNSNSISPLMVGLIILLLTAAVMVLVWLFVKQRPSAQEANPRTPEELEFTQGLRCNATGPGHGRSDGC